LLLRNFVSNERLTRRATLPGARHKM